MPIQLTAENGKPYSFTLLPVPEGFVNACPTAILAPGIVVGSVDKPAHHCLYQSRPVIWRGGKPELIDLPQVTAGIYRSTFYPLEAVESAAAAITSPHYSTAGVIAGRVQFAMKSELEDGVVPFGVLWDLNGRIIRIINQPRSWLSDVNRSGYAVGTMTDYVGRKFGIITSAEKPPLSLEKLLKQPGSWAIFEAYKINDCGSILARGCPRSRIGHTQAIVLVPSDGGYEVYPAGQWLYQALRADETWTVPSRNWQPLGPGKIGLALHQMEAQLKLPTTMKIRVHKHRLSWKSQRKPRCRTTIQLRPGKVLLESASFEVYLLGRSDDGVILGGLDKVLSNHVNSVLIQRQETTLVYQWQMSGIPDGVVVNDPLVIGAKRELSGQCRVNGVYNAYLAEPL